MSRLDQIESSWGSSEYLSDMMRRYSPSLDEAQEAAWASYLRQSASPGAIAAFERMNMLIDVRPVLPAIHTPTLVAHRKGDMVVDVGAGRFLAEGIPGARFAELPGGDHSPFTGDFQQLVGTVEEFLGKVWGDRGWEDAEPDRVLATVLFTDIVGSTARAAELGDARWRELLEAHHTLIRRQLVRFRGRELVLRGTAFSRRSTGRPARFAVHPRSPRASASSGSRFAPGSTPASAR